MKYSTNWIFVLCLLLSLGSLTGKGGLKGRKNNKGKNWNRYEFSDQVRQKFSLKSNIHLQKLAKSFLELSYKYLGTAYFFQRSDVALPGVSAYFLKLSEEERNNADSILKYINLRGGDVVLYNLQAPANWNWTDTTNAIENALHEERSVNERTLKAHHDALFKSDGHLTHYLETGIIDQKVRKIRQLGEYSTQLRKLKRNNYGLGEYKFDSYIGV